MNNSEPALLPAQIQNQPILYKQEQIDLIKRTICKDATHDELQMFVQQCERTRLDPFTRQIYFIKSNGKVNIMASIDGLRLIAERTGKYAGQTKVEWCGDDGKWVDVWLLDKPPAAARVGVHKTDFIEPLYATARYKAYAGGYMWQKMPDHMIAKVAESLALRKAFPNEMSGVYGEDEIKYTPKYQPTDEINREPIIEDVIDSDTGEVVRSHEEPRLDALDLLLPVAERSVFFKSWENKGFTKATILKTITDNCAGVTLSNLDKKFTHRLRHKIDDILQEKLDADIPAGAPGDPSNYGG